MSQRNPMNERYTSEARGGKTRKSAAAAKPKSKAASTVIEGTTKKTKQQRKADARAERKRLQAEQRELDRKYYTPDTKRYRTLRKVWWGLLVAAIACTALSFLGRSFMPEMLSMIVLFGAYGFIIAAFYVDFSKIRKERQAYQQRMKALEEEEARKQRKQARAQAAHGPKGASHAAKEAEEKAEGEQKATGKPRRRGLFGSGFRLAKEQPAKDEGPKAEEGAEKAAAAK